ncbi:MAG: hypothetical protein P8Y63_16105, partial [Deltaproteobacteria bacterium]
EAELVDKSYRGRPPFLHGRFIHPALAWEINNATHNRSSCDSPLCMVFLQIQPVKAIRQDFLIEGQK